MQYRKYEFNTQQEWNTLKNTLELDSNKNPTNCSAVEFGNLVTTAPTFDVQGNMLTAPIYSTKFAVDILWPDNNIPAAFKQYETWPLNCQYMFQGMEGLYFEAYNNR